MENHPPPSLGIFTTDDQLRVRTWDDWLAAISGFSAEDVRGRPLTEIIPDLEARGLLGKFNHVLQEGAVEVLAPLFHRYLLPYPPLIPSETFAHMRQQVTLIPLREGDRITGVMVSVEDATRRLEKEKDLRQGSESADAVRASSHAAPLVQALGDRNWRVRKQAVTGLIQHGGPQATAALLRTLQAEHEDLGALNSALEVLTFSRVDVIPPLLELLGKGDGDLRLYVAQVLGDKRDARAIPALVKSLDDADPNLRYHVVEALGKLRAAEAVDDLLNIVESGDFYLAFPAIDALNRIGDPRVAPRLVPLLKNDLLMAPVSELLGNLGDEEVLSPLVDLLNQPGAHVTVIASAMAALCDRYETLYHEGEHIADLAARCMAPAGLQNLLDALPHARDDEIRSLAMVLGWLEGPAVERSLTRLMGHPAARGEVVEALVRYGGRVTDLLTAQLTSEELDIRYAAVIALGRIGDPKAVPALVKTLSRDPELTVVAAGALAKIGDRQAYTALLGLMGHPQTAVRQAVISALNSLGHPQMPQDMNRLMGDADPRVRESAVKIAGYFGFVECIPALLKRCRDSHEGVRRAVVEHLPYLEEESADGEVISALHNETPKVRVSAAKAMAHLGREIARAPLMAALEDKDQWVRFFAVRSVSRHGYGHAGERIYRMAASDPSPLVRIAAIGAAGRIHGEKSVAFLAPYVTADDPDIARSAIEALGEVGPPHAMPALLPALRSEDASLKIAAIQALGRWNTPEAAEMLQWMAASGKTDETTGAALAALTAMGTSEAVSALAQLTADPAVRDGAVAALSGLRGPAIDALGAHLSHPQMQVKRAVIDALTRMKHPRASAYLLGALADSEPRIRVSAIRALAKLGNRASRDAIFDLARNDPDLSVKREARKALTKL